MASARGEKGAATRIAGPAGGAPFTCCSRAAGREGAAGQIALYVMRDRYRADQLTEQSFVIGLIAGTGQGSGGRYQGIAPGVRIINLRVLGPSGEGSDSAVIVAIERATYTAGSAARRASASAYGRPFGT